MKPWLLCALLQCILAFQSKQCIATVQGRKSVQHRQSRKASWCLDSLTSSADFLVQKESNSSDALCMHLIAQSG